MQIELKEEDFIKKNFLSTSKQLQEKIIESATSKKNLDTVLSLQKDVSYTYNNSGDGKGYLEQVSKNKHMHTINKNCYEFLLYAKPYIILNDSIFSFEQGLGMDCSTGDCFFDTVGIREATLVVLPLNKILKHN